MTQKIYGYEFYDCRKCGYYQDCLINQRKNPCYWTHHNSRDSQYEISDDLLKFRIKKIDWRCVEDLKEYTFKKDWVMKLKNKKEKKV